MEIIHDLVDGCDPQSLHLLREASIAHN